MVYGPLPIRIGIPNITEPSSHYRDQKYDGSETKLEKELRTSTTLYVGNLSFYTTEEQIYQLFSKCGEIKRIIMGLNHRTKTPCGFCFVEYYTRPDARACAQWVNGARLDDRVIRTDWDAGFKEGRQYGRGNSGGQVRDEFRTDYDPGRGGYGKLAPVAPPSGMPISTPPPTLGKRGYSEMSSGGNAYSNEPQAKRSRLSDADRVASAPPAKEEAAAGGANPRFRGEAGEGSDEEMA